MQVCTSSQTATPTSHHSVFYRPDALPAAQPTAWKQRQITPSTCWHVSHVFKHGSSTQCRVCVPYTLPWLRCENSRLTVAVSEPSTAASDMHAVGVSVFLAADRWWSVCDSLVDMTKRVHTPMSQTDDSVTGLMTTAEVCALFTMLGEQITDRHNIHAISLYDAKLVTIVLFFLAAGSQWVLVLSVVADVVHVQTAAQ